MLNRRRFVKFLVAVAAALSARGLGGLGPLGRALEAAGAAHRRLLLARGDGGIWGLTASAANGRGGMARAGGVAGIAVGASGDGTFAATDGIVGIEWIE